MAESGPVLRKKMRFSSSSTQHSTDQKQAHNKCSGQILPSVSHTGNRILAEKLETKLSTRVYSRVTIKDLRLRRVLSRPSSSNDWELYGKGDNRSKEQDKESFRHSRNPNVAKGGSKDSIDGLGASRDDLEGEEITQTTPPDTELFSSETVLVQESNVSLVNGSEKKTSLKSKSEVFHPGSRAKIFKSHGSFSYRRLLPYLMEAADDTISSSQSSKPNRSFDHVHLNINSTNGVENGKIMNANTQDPKELVGESISVIKQSGETRFVSLSVDSDLNKRSDGNTRLLTMNESGPIRKSVGFKRKLFRTPDSVNYRRLLPYVRDNPKDSPRVSSISYHLDPLKNKKEEALLVLSVPENEARQSLDATRDACSSDDSGLQLLEHVSESPELSDHGKGQDTQVKHVIPDTEKKTEIPFELSESKMPLCSLADSRHSSDVNTSILKPKRSEAENSVAQAEAMILNASVVSLETPASNSPLKGNLKRNLGECRGLCTCLNCSSFRLHAERAFEFSRNQLKGTEELVLDLIGEISNLKDMLENHVSADHQVGKACQRAFEATEVAKSRLHQMDNDLQAHCRNPTEQRESVKFADSLGEKTILNDYR